MKYTVICKYNLNRKLSLYNGNYRSIGGEVHFLLGIDHSLHYVSTFPLRRVVLKSGIDAVSKGDIIVDDDVWLGQGAIIMSGVHIGQ